MAEGRGQIGPCGTHGVVLSFVNYIWSLFVRSHKLTDLTVAGSIFIREINVVLWYRPDCTDNSRDQQGRL